MPLYRLLVAATSIDRSHLALFAGLRAAGVEVRLLFDPASPRREAILREFPEAGFLTVRHRLDLRAVRELRRRIAAWPPDVRSYLAELAQGAFDTPSNHHTSS